MQTIPFSIFFARINTKCCHLQILASMTTICEFFIDIDAGPTYIFIIFGLFHLGSWDFSNTKGIWQSPYCTKKWLHSFSWHYSTHFHITFCNSILYNWFWRNIACNIIFNWSWWNGSIETNTHFSLWSPYPKNHQNQTTVSFTQMSGTRS